MTLDRVIVDLRRAFEASQLYVARRSHHGLKNVQKDANTGYSQQSQISQGLEGRRPSAKASRRCQRTSQGVLREVFEQQTVVIADASVVAGSAVVSNVIS